MTSVFLVVTLLLITGMNRIPTLFIKNIIFKISKPMVNINAAIIKASMKSQKKLNKRHNGLSIYA